MAIALRNVPRLGVSCHPWSPTLGDSHWLQLLRTHMISFFERLCPGREASFYPKNHSVNLSVVIVVLSECKKRAVLSGNQACPCPRDLS